MPLLSCAAVLTVCQIGMWYLSSFIPGTPVGHQEKLVNTQPCVVPQHPPSNSECTMELMGSQSLKAVLLLIESGVAILSSCSIGPRLHQLGVIDFGLGFYATSINTPATDKNCNALHAQPSSGGEMGLGESSPNSYFFCFCPDSCLCSVILSLLLFETVQARLHSRAFKCSSTH